MLMLLSMRPTLDARAPVRFSKTARSRPRHSEARRSAICLGFVAVVRRRLADDLPERPAERSEAQEPNVEADLGDAVVGLPQHEHRPLNPSPLQVPVRCLAERRAK